MILRNDFVKFCELIGFPKPSALQVDLIRQLVATKEPVVFMRLHKKPLSYSAVARYVQTKLPHKRIRTEPIQLPHKQPVHELIIIDELSEVAS